LCLERLEDRTVPSAAVQALATPGYVLAPTTSGATPDLIPGQDGYTPQQIAVAYGFNKITPPSGQLLGSGTTIAIVDAYNDPTISTDLATFDSTFGLPNPTLTVVSQTGSTTKLPSANAGWSVEISLDVEWAHAVAPGANILLVEASSSSENNLFTAESYAASQPGVVVVSNSWGGSEFSGESSYDSTFTTPSGHAGVTFVVAAGDSGAPDEYPSASPDVLSVGGTTLNLADSTGDYGSESAWAGSGGGVSAYESQPSYQKGVVSAYSTTARTNPDVSYDADPNTGFPVDDSYANGTSNPWEQVGGTSDAAPQWAALVAIADQGRIAAGEPTLTGAQTLQTLYSLPQSDFHDVTTGSSTGSPSEAAGPGYDLATGRGTPVANLVVAGLVGTSSTQVTQFAVTPSSGTETAGTPFTVTVTAENSSGATVTGYSGTITVKSSDGKAVLPTGSVTFTNGVATFNATLETAGSQTIKVTDNTGTITASTVLTVVANPTVGSIAFLQQPPATVTAGATITPAVSVELFDAYGNLETKDSTDKVSLALNPSSGGLTGTTTVTVSAGVATFSGLSVANIGTGDTLAASLVNTSLTATSSAFNVVDSATHFVVTTNAASPDTAGTQFTVTVTAEDGANRVFTGYTGPVTLTSSDGQAVLPSGSSVTFTAGVATFSATLKTAGSQTITVTDSSTSSITGSAAVTVVANPVVNSVSFLAQPPATVVRGASFGPVTVELLDAYGNVETNDSTDEVSLALGGGSGTLSGGAPTLVKNGVATFSGLKLNAPAAAGYTLQASLVGTILGATSKAFTVADPVTHFVVTTNASNPDTAGTVLTVTATAEDASGYTVTGYAGPVTVTSTDGQAVLPPVSGSVTFTAGVATFSATLKTAGNQSITVADTSTGASGSAAVTVTAAALSQLGFVQQPTNTTVGTAINPAVTVALEDAYGNVVTTDSSDQISLAIGTNPGGGTLSGGGAVTVSAGVATFNNLSINNAGAGYTLVASSTPAVLGGATLQATSAAFTVSGGGTTTIEGFENGLMLYHNYGLVVDGALTIAAHDGTYGLDVAGDNTSNPGWVVRTDAAATVQQGETIGVWVQFDGTADGRAYFAFGSSTTSTLAAVLAPNTDQLIVQYVGSYTKLNSYENLAAVTLPPGESYQPNVWYHLEVNWAVGGAITASVYSANGTTLLASTPQVTVLGLTSGGFGFRAIDSQKFFDTVTVTGTGSPLVEVAGGANTVGKADAAALNVALLPAAPGAAAAPAAALTAAGASFSLAPVALALVGRAGGAAEVFQLPAGAPGSPAAVAGFGVTGPLRSPAGATPSAPAEPGAADAMAPEDGPGLGPLAGELPPAPQGAVLPPAEAAPGDVWFLAEGLWEESAEPQAAGLEGAGLDLSPADPAVDAAVAALLLSIASADARRDDEQRRR
jgi:hypothetical protein